MFDWVDENKKNLKALGPMLTSKLYFPHFEFVLPDEAEEAMSNEKKAKEKFDASEHHSGELEESFEEASSESHEGTESDAEEADESATYTSQ